MNIKKITVLYNSVDEVKKGEVGDSIAEAYNYKAAEDVSNALIKLGYEVTLFDLNSKTLKLLPSIKTDMIFNLLEGFDNLPQSFTAITSYIESLGIPMTGTNSFAAMLTIDKARTKDFLVKNKIPTPNYQLFIHELEPLKYNLRFPLIVKPNSADASMGITQDSVVKNSAELREQIQYVREVYKDAALVEEYIEGKEMDCYGVKVNDGVIVSNVLEAPFIPDSSRKWDICDFEHKWGETGYCDEICPAQIAPETQAWIERLVAESIKIFDIKGCMRLDLRLSKDNIPYVIEVNTNPGMELSHDTTEITNFITKGITYVDLVRMIVDNAAYEYENKLLSSKPFLKDSNLVKSE